MRVEPTIREAAELGRAVAELIADGVVAAAGRPYLLGCPSGRTPMAVYEALAQIVEERRIDLGSLHIVMMDEYLIAESGELEWVDIERSYSCRGFARDIIHAPLAQACQRVGVTPPPQPSTPDPADPHAYERMIADAGGIDFFILASGASDGHVAFNQPGTPRETTTHIVELGIATRTDNMSTFPEFTELSMVPAHGISVGVATIADHSASVAMILIGSDKQHAYRRLTGAERYEPDWPATIFTECANAHLFADPSAAAR